jgi:hypothetical protein
MTSWRKDKQSWIKADFKSKSQNIWQQIILFSSTVMQMICMWHKIWTLSGRLSLIVDEKKKYIYSVCTTIEGHSVTDFDTQYGEQNLEIDD